MKSIWGKRLVIILLAVSLFLVLAVLLLPKVVDPNRYSGLIASEIEAVVGGKTVLGPMSWGIARRVWFQADGFAIKNATAFPGDLELSRVYAEVSIFPLLFKKVQIQELNVEGPFVTLRLKPAPAGDQGAAEIPRSQWPEGKTDATVDAPARGRADVETVGEDRQRDRAPSWQISIEKFMIRNGRVKLEDSLTLPGERIERVFPGLEMEATNLAPGRETAFEIAFRDDIKPGLGAFRTKGTFSGLTEAFTIENPKLKFKATLSTMDVDLIKPYLKDSPLAQRLGGRVSLEMDYEGDFGKHFRSEGTIDLTRISYADPTLWEKPLQGAETELAYQLSMNGHLLNLERMTLRLGGLSLSAKAQVIQLLTEPLIKDAVLSSDLPLAELDPLLPYRRLGKHGDLIRQTMEAGGRITIEELTLPEFRLSQFPDGMESLFPQVKGSARFSDISFRPSPELPELEGVTGSIRLETAVATVQGLTARVGPVRLPEIDAEVKNLLEGPEIAARVRGSLNMTGVTDEETMRLLQRSGIKGLAGTAGLDLELRLETAQPERFRIEGQVGLKDVELSTTLTPASLKGLNAIVTLSPQAVEIPKLTTTVMLPAPKGSSESRFSVDLNGHVADWRNQPTLNLRSLKTSAISLAPLATAIPWEKMGKPAGRIRETLLAGGMVNIENLAVSEVDLKNLPVNPLTLIAGTLLEASFSDLSVKPGPSVPPLEELTGHVTLQQGVLRATNVTGRMRLLTFPIMDFQVTGLTGKPVVSAAIKGPLRFAGRGGPPARKLLRKYGLQSISGSGAINMRARYDHAKPEQWEVSGSFVLEGIQAKTHPAGVLLEDLRGLVTWSRQRSLDVTLTSLTGTVNQSPFRFDGKVSRGGTPQMIIDLKAHTQHLDLAHVGDLVPPLEGLGLAGKLDMDLDLHLPFADPPKSRVEGILKTTGVALRLPSKDLAVREGSADLKFSGNAGIIHEATFLLNDQKLSLSGEITRSSDLNARLFLKSPDLNINRLLRKTGEGPAPDSKTPRRQKGETEAGKRLEEVTGRAELPRLFRAMTAELEIQVEHGLYHGQEFQDLTAKAHYERGLLKHHEFDVRMAGGRLGTKGSADLRDLQQISFALEPVINDLPAAALAALSGAENFVSFRGPITASGRLQGRTGSTRDLLGSLSGNLEVEVGRGRIEAVGPAGKLLLNILDFTSVQGIISGRVFSNLKSEGISFQSVKARALFDHGIMNIESSRLESDAFNFETRGTVGLVSGELNMQAQLEPLATVSGILGRVPLAGKTAQSLTRVYLSISGSVDRPKISLSPVKGITEGAKEAVKAPGGFLKGLFDLFTKGQEESGEAKEPDPANPSEGIRP